MELHKEIRDLVRAHGPAIVEDPNGFRAGLEDLLGDESMPPGLVNLLVDAVRHQAVWSLVRIVDNGGDPVSAIRDAGQRFALARGGGDPAMCGWACAVLGYGMGRVDDATLAKFSSTHMPPPPPPPPPDKLHSRETIWAPQPPPVPPPVPPPAPRPSRKRWPWVVAGAVVLVLLLVVAGGVAWWRLGPDDDDAPSAGQSEQDDEGGEGTDGGDGGDGDGGDGDGETIDLAEVNARYSDLGSDITARVSSCVEVEPPAGVEEVLDCTVPAGTLKLSKFASSDDLEIARLQVIDTRPNTLSGQERGRAFYAFDPEYTDQREPGQAELYWDSKFAALAAHLRASTGYDYEDLETEFSFTDPTVQEPSEPGNPRLIAYMNEDWTGEVGECERIFTFSEGEIEENLCSLTHPRLGEFDVYAATFRTKREFLNYRENVVDAENADGVYTGGTWCVNCDTPDEITRGEYHGYVDSEGTSDESGVFYVDDPVCRCYLEVWGREGEGRGNPDRLSGTLLGKA